MFIVPGGLLMVGPYQLILKVAVEMSMLWNELRADLVHPRQQPPGQGPDQVQHTGLVVHNLLSVVFPPLV